MVGVGLDMLWFILSLALGKASNKLMPLIIPRRYMSSPSFREGVFLCVDGGVGGVGVVGLGVEVGVGGVGIGPDGGVVTGVGFGVFGC